jgi:aspartate racemase
MKKVGIIGGLGPASTPDYYLGIINGYRAKAGDDNYPKIVINSLNMTEVLSYTSSEDWDTLVDVLVDAIHDAAYAGAEFAAIASNTPHIVFDRVAKQARLPLISIVDVTCRTARAKGCKLTLLLGTRFTMSSGFYPEALKKYDIEAIVPSKDEQALIHNLIFPKLENGIVVPEDKQKMLELVSRLIKEHEADAVILGCTELPLMIKDGDLETLLLNTTQIHIDAIVAAI